MVDTVASFSFLTHFGQLMKGVDRPRDRAVLRLADRGVPDPQHAPGRPEEGRVREQRDAGKLTVDRRQLAIVGIVLAVVLFVALNICGSLSLRSHRLDLTEHHQYTLSKGTEQLLARVDGADHPAALRLARAARRQPVPRLLRRSRARPAAAPTPRRSGGRIVVEYIDPEQFSPEEDRAVGFGLEPVSLEGGASSGYFGIAGTNSTDDVDVLPVLSPEREAFLEYDLTRMVNNLANPDKPVVALVSSLPLNARPGHAVPALAGDAGAAAVLRRAR